MKVLIICSYNSGTISPFVKEQVNSLRKIEVKIDYFKVKGKGTSGYLSNLKSLKETIRVGHYDLVHAHYGLSGLLSTFQRLVPTVITFHGSDVNSRANRFFSIFASRFSHHNILVNSQMVEQLFLKNGYKIIPCGVDFDIFSPIDKREARHKLGLNPDQHYILFSSAFDNPVKNYPLAKRAIDLLDEHIELIELKNKTRKEVSLLFNACNLLLMTSLTEGSPQVVKEALACNTPVISTDVGDVKSLIEGLSNCYITSYDPKDIAQKLSRVLENNGDCRGRPVVQDFELQNVAQSVKKVYSNVLKDKS